MANTIREKELKTKYDYPNPDVLNLIPQRGSFVPKRKKAGYG